MFEKTKFEHSENPSEKAEEILAGSNLELEDKTNENVGQHLGRTPKKISSFNEAFDPTEEGKEVIKEKLKDIKVGLEKEYDGNIGQSTSKQEYEQATQINKKTQDVIKEKLEGSELENATLEDINN